MAFERGHRDRAYRILHDNVNDLLDSDHIDVTRMVAVEFITMGAATGRLTQAADVLTYLDTTGDFGAFARDALIAEAVRQIAANLDLSDRPDDRNLSAHEALTLMRDTLAELIHQGV